MPSAIKRDRKGHFLGRLRVDIIKGSQMSSPPSVRPSVTETFFDFNEIWYVDSGWWVMHDGVQYDPIQGQGHEPLKVGNLAIFKCYLLPDL